MKFSSLLTFTIMAILVLLIYFNLLWSEFVGQRMRTLVAWIANQIAPQLTGHQLDRPVAISLYVIVPSLFVLVTSLTLGLWGSRTSFLEKLLVVPISVGLIAFFALVWWQIEMVLLCVLFGGKCL